MSELIIALGMAIELINGGSCAESAYQLVHLNESALYRRQADCIDADNKSLRYIKKVFYEYKSTPENN